jgi:hypothetical protein
LRAVRQIGGLIFVRRQGGFAVLTLVIPGLVGWRAAIERVIRLLRLGLSALASPIFAPAILGLRIGPVCRRNAIARWVSGRSVGRVGHAIVLNISSIWIWRSHTAAERAGSGGEHEKGSKMAQGALR